jgi:hypothetical protein
MDIIATGGFAITNRDGKTVLSFRVPSVECIDFVKQMQAHPPVGRNDPCPCGSGKKFKKCHGRIGQESGLSQQSPPSTP